MIQLELLEMEEGFKLQLKKDGRMVYSFAKPIIIEIKVNDVGIDLANSICIQGNKTLALSLYDASTQTMKVVLKDLQPIVFKEKVDFTFTDLETLDEKEAIDELAARGVVTGLTITTFAPANHVTREQFLTMLHRIFQFDITGKTVNFTDVSEEHWAYEAIVAAKDQGIIKGKSQTQFGLGDTITKQEMAVMVYNTLVCFDSTLFDEKQVEGYLDESSIADYAKEAVKKLKALGILEGEIFEPTQIVTRSEACSMLYKMIEQLK